MIEKGWKDLNRLDIGKKIGTSGTGATYYMNGDRLPSVAQAKTLCKIFGGICVEWFLTGRGPKYPGEEVNLQHYINVTDLTPAQIQETNEFIAFKKSQNLSKTLENNPNKALTTPIENVGGGVNMPVQQAQSQDRRESDRSIMLKEIAIEQERCMVEKHQEAIAIGIRFNKLIKDSCENNKCFCVPACKDANDHSRTMSFKNLLATHK